MFTHGLQNAGHFLTLPLGSDVGTDPLLQKLEASLVLGNTQQFHSALFVGRESGNFSNQITDKLVVLGLFALVVGGLLPQLVGGGLVTFVETGANLVFGCHAVTQTVKCQEHIYVKRFMVTKTKFYTLF